MHPIVQKMNILGTRMEHQAQEMGPKVNVIKTLFDYSGSWTLGIRGGVKNYPNVYRQAPHVVVAKLLLMHIISLFILEVMYCLFKLYHFKLNGIYVIN